MRVVVVAVEVVVVVFVCVTVVTVVVVAVVPVSVVVVSDVPVNVVVVFVAVVNVVVVVVCVLVVMVAEVVVDVAVTDVIVPVLVMLVVVMQGPHQTHALFAFVISGLPHRPSFKATHSTQRGGLFSTNCKADPLVVTLQNQSVADPSTSAKTGVTAIALNDERTINSPPLGEQDFL